MPWLIRLCLLVILGAPSSHDPGPLTAAYAMATSSQGDVRIFVQSGDESTAIQVSRARSGQDHVVDLWPSWSSNAQRLAFARTWGVCPLRCHAALMTVRRDGAQQHELHVGRYVDTEWSPRGHRLAAVRSGRRASRGIWIFGRDGRARRVLAGMFDSLAWLPGGRSLVVARIVHRDHPDLFRLVLRGRKLTRLIDGPTRWRTTPTMSTDGRWLVFQGQAHKAYQLYALRWGTQRIHQLTHGSTDASFPAFVPQTDAIWFGRGAGSGVYSVDVRSRDLVRLPLPGLAVGARPAWTPR